MADAIGVRFTYLTGVARPLFQRAWLAGSWDRRGRWSAEWSRREMTQVRGSDGCPAFTVLVELDPDQAGWLFRWGVELERGGERVWGIMQEESRVDSTERIRSFRLQAPGPRPQHEIYALNRSRRLGAQKEYADGDPAEAPGIRFSAWAPNALAVEACIGHLWRSGDPRRAPLIDPGRRSGSALASTDRAGLCGGYVSDQGEGLHPTWGPFAMRPRGDGVWESDHLPRFELFDHVPYMFRVTRRAGDGGQERVFRTDMFSRCQIGFGSVRPAAGWDGAIGDLDGSVSCSVVVDPDHVATEFREPVWPETRWTPQDAFFTDLPPDPRLATLDRSDLVIYELHVGALGAGRRRPDEPGTLEDALALLDHLEDLGVNAVELLPLSEFGGNGAGWGYATSHYFAIEYSGGGRDQYKHFIRECHRRGIAVILDVVYNHYNHQAYRAEWQYDDPAHDRNVYYWYEGRPGDYPRFDAAVAAEHRGEGGYLDNLSTAYAPRYWEEHVRAMFVSSALALAAEFQVDGLRVDQTTSIHAYNVLHADGRALPGANAFGGKLLRELTRSLKLVAPRIVLMAEDHSGWTGVTEDPSRGGLGFDAVWYADFYHHLVGDTDKGAEYAKLVKTAGYGDDRPLAMTYFAGALQATAGGRKVVYHESHDEAGNGKLTDRTINVAVNGAPLVGETRRTAEARCRFAAGVTLLSAGIPMFLFGEEVGSDRKFVYGEVLRDREDFVARKKADGRSLFEYYRQLVRLRRAHPGLRSPDIDVLFVHDAHRLLGFRRWGGGEDFLVFASLNRRAFDAPGYTFHAERIPAGAWKEVFNSDAAAYGGDGRGNLGLTLRAGPGELTCVVPANGVVVFQRVG
jgi:1,4-alpha-glucan branching enzyme